MRIDTSSVGDRYNIVSFSEADGVGTDWRIHRTRRYHVAQTTRAREVVAAQY